MKKTSETSAGPLLPQSLVKGDTIGLVAPAGPIGDIDRFHSGIRLIEEFGFQVKFERDIERRKEYLAGSDQHRLKEFHDLWADNEVKAILAVRGGYGSLRMVSSLDMDLIRQHPKMLIGFSDICVLLTAFLKQTNLVGFHGPMVTTLPGCNRSSIQAFFNAITGRAADRIKPTELEILSPGQAEGRLFGGNLTTLVHLLGTPYELSWDNSILFLEDVNEAPYRIDRILTHLKEAGKLEKINGIILGKFQDCGDEGIIWNRILELMGENKIPIWSNFPSGHCENNQILPLGIPVQMDSANGTLLFRTPWTS